MEGPGQNSITSNPLLVNYSNALEAADFQLTDSSPAKNSGLNLGYKLDFDGSTIPKDGLPDIGAFEY